jgi:hypothetical protein
LLGRDANTSGTRPSLTDDRPASAAVLDDLVTRAVDGARQEGAGRSVARALGVVLLLIAALRLVFDDVLPRLVLVCLSGVVLAAVAVVVSHAVIEGRRRHALLVALAHVTRTARIDEATRAALIPQIEAIVSALREAPSPWPWAPSRKHL